mgnify:FL=1
MTLSGALVNGLANAAATALVSIGICLNALYRPKGRGSTPPLRCHCEPVRRLVARSVPHPAQNHGPPASPEGRFIR